MFPHVLAQLRGDRTGRGPAARSKHSRELIARTATADKVVQSVCPYCAVGCGQKVYVKDERVVQIEGDPDSPISRGRLCPKGSASEQLVNSPRRRLKVKYRRPHGTRAETWEESTADGKPLRRTRGFAFLGGATLDSEENYLIKKGFSALGAISI